MGGSDIGLLLAQWGPGSGSADLNEDGLVSGADLGAMLGAWGWCPCEESLEFDPIHDGSEPLEPAIVEHTRDAMITRIADRARDRHAREDIVNGVPFRTYDHWLPFYWEQRVAEIEIIDRAAKGGDGLTVNFVTLDRLNPAEFRTFYASGFAGYHNNMSDFLNAGVTLVSSGPSERYPGETEYRYTAEIQNKWPEQTPLAIGDRMEIELSQFLAAPRNGRLNYYGTAMLYVVGEGIVPWYAKAKEEASTPEEQAAASFDSFPLPEHAWLGGQTTLPYQYSNEPDDRFKQMAGNISHASGHAFTVGRRLHHTDFDSGVHSEDGKPDSSPSTSARLAHDSSTPVVWPATSETVGRYRPRWARRTTRPSSKWGVTPMETRIRFWEKCSSRARDPRRAAVAVAAVVMVMRSSASKPKISR